jgi:flagellar hook-basal body complex protein FliE
MSDSLRIEGLSPQIEMGNALRGTKGMAVEGIANEQLLQAGESTKTFSEIFKNSLDQVNLHQVQADQSIKELLAGRSKNIHETLLAIERADTSLKLMMQVRNKVLDAYREIMRMQV